jgi:hypothetical protein
MGRNESSGSAGSRPYGSRWRPWLKALGVLVFLGFVVPVALGFWIQHRAAVRSGTPVTAAADSTLV